MLKQAGAKLVGVDHWAAKDGKPLRNFANHPKSLTFARASLPSDAVNIVVPKYSGRIPAKSPELGRIQQQECEGLPAELRILQDDAWILLVNFILRELTPKRYKPSLDRKFHL